MKVLDLTHEVKTGMMKYPGDPDISLTEVLAHDTDYCHVDYLQCGSHTGTHIDAPYHFLPDGKRITDFPVSRFIREGDFLLIQTGWYRKFGTEEYLDHPYISKEAAKRIVKLGVSIVAVDFLNVDPTRKERWDAHPVLLSNDVLIVENINHSLRLDAAKRYRFHFVPLKLRDSDGSPIRAFAVEP